MTPPGDGNFHVVLKAHQQKPEQMQQETTFDAQDETNVNFNTYKSTK